MQLIAYTYILGNAPGTRIGTVKFGESGYYPTQVDRTDWTMEQVKEKVRELNVKEGIPEDVAQSAALGSMFGWDVPAARAAKEWLEYKAE